jgi:3-oxoacyl-(acyl-carrier-protein) synthase
MAIGDALDDQLGRADAMIAGGSEAPSRGSASPGSTRCGPLPAERRPIARLDRSTRNAAGLDGEAAGAIVLEELERAKGRGAKTPS